MKCIYTLLLLCFFAIQVNAQRLTFKSNNNYQAPENPSTIITNGLLLYLNANTYKGTGATWMDLSPLQNNATIVGAPTYSSSPASLSFGNNQYATTAINNLAFTKPAATFIAWINPSRTQTQWTGIIFNRRPNGNPPSQVPATGINLFANNAVGYHWNDAPSTYNWNSGLSVPNNAWSMIVITINASSATAYLCNANGVASATNNVANPPLSNLNFYIACDPYNIANRVFVGKIGVAMIYDATLTRAEITSIFNAQKSFFGL